MDELIKCFLEQLKKDDIGTDEIKPYMILIKRCIEKYAESYEENETPEKISKDFLQDFIDAENNNLETATNASLLLAEYNSCKQLIEVLEQEKMGVLSPEININSIMSSAKKVEQYKGSEDLTNKYSLNLTEAMALLLRKIIREVPEATSNHKKLLKAAVARKELLEGQLKEILIPSIQRNVSFLNDFGVIDKLIDESNTYLSEIGLEDLNVCKRFEPPAEYRINGKNIRFGKDGELHKYDPSGKIIRDDDPLNGYPYDFGVLDSLDTEFLEGAKLGQPHLTVEDLYMLDVYWKEQYTCEKLKLGNAITTFKHLDLWKNIFKISEEEIKSIKEEDITNANKKDVALSYLSRYTGKIPEKAKTQYARFMTKSGLPKFGNLEREVASQQPFFNAISDSLQGVYLQQNYVLSNLQAGNFEVSDWGLINEGDVNDEGEKIYTIAVENPKFRGPLIFAVPENWVKAYFSKKNMKFPKFKDVGEVDQTLQFMVSKLLIPASYHYNKTLKNTNIKSKTLEELSENAGLEHE